MKLNTRRIGFFDLILGKLTLMISIFSSFNFKSRSLFAGPRTIGLKIFLFKYFNNRSRLISAPPNFPDWTMYKLFFFTVFEFLFKYTHRRGRGERREKFNLKNSAFLFYISVIPCDFCVLNGSQI